MIKYTWNIEGIDSNPKIYGMTNVIQSVDWRLIGTDENGVTSDIYGKQSLSEPSIDTFKEITVVNGQITTPNFKETIVEWLVSIFSVQNTVETIPNIVEVIPTQLELFKKSISDAIDLKNAPKNQKLTL